MTSPIAEKKSWASIVGNPSAKEYETLAVIEIHEEIASAPPTEESNKIRRNYSQDVDPLAFDIARDFYEQFRDEITQIQRRGDLEDFFRQEFSSSEREFSVVLYALAKGLRVVNCFNRGRSLEWKPAPKWLKTGSKRISRKTKVKGSDGWISVGAMATHQTILPESYPETPVHEKVETISKKVDEEDEAKFAKEEVTSQKPDETHLIHLLQEIKLETRKMDNEIEELIPFHRQHLREKARLLESGSDAPYILGLVDFHDLMARQLEDKLDEIQDLINAKHKELNRVCDMLKL